jgi:nitrite reductase/ring-hydroxylating ferredoxin subunit
MAAWHEIPGAAALESGEMIHHEVDGTDILVLHRDGAWSAFVNRCGHMNAPLDLGTFKGGVLKCPLHNAVFDAITGEVRGPPVLGGSGVDPARLPAEMQAYLARAAPIMGRVGCAPLTPLPLVASPGSVRVFA